MLATACIAYTPSISLMRGSLDQRECVPHNGTSIVSAILHGMIHTDRQATLRATFTAATARI